MPNSSKIEKVGVLKEKIEKAQSIIMVDYKGIKVSEDTELRKAMRESNVEYIVAKNRLFKIALQEAGVEDNFDEVLEGTTAFAFGYDDVVAPARVVNDFAKKFKKCFNIKAGLLQKKRIEIFEIERLANFPSREGLLGQIAGSMLSIITKFAYVVNAVKEKKENE